MGQEIEYKLCAEGEAALSAAYAALRQAGQAEPERTYAMHTRYFDTPSGFLRQRRWTLRIRLENDISVLTCKTAGADHARGEWNLARTAEGPVPTPSELDSLVRMGAPQQIAHLAPLEPVCAARFTRRCYVLTLPDGTRIEVAADLGELCGPSEHAPLCELELELISGDRTQLARLADATGLREELLSKLARALQLR